MNPLQNTKIVNTIPPGVIKDNASFTAVAVDCKGWDWAMFVFNLGATDIAMAALKIQESNDDAVADAYADVTGASFASGTDIDGAAAALPSATNDNGIFAVELDLRNRERYLKPVATAGDGSTGTYLAGVCILGRGEIAPITNAGRGAVQVLRV